MFSGEFATSDAIRILNAIGAYTLEYSKSSTRADKFCEGNFIRTKAMEEIRRLRQQLTHIVKSAVLSSGDEGTTATSNFPSVIKLSMDPSIAPPSKKDLALIRQIMLSGYPDHVCRLDIDVARRFPALAGIGGKNAMPVYQSMWSEQHEVLQIHPSSAIHRTRPAPEWIVFQDIVGKEERLSADNTSLVATRNKEVTGITLLGAPLNKKPASTLQTYAQQQKPTKKLWLKGVTIVSEKWLYPLGSRMFVNQGKMLEQPEPKYDYKKDEVLVFVLPHYGPKLWDLNPTEIALANNATSPNKFMWFAKLLVEGKVRLTSNNNNSTKKSVFEAVQVKEIFEFQVK